jgi:hypothetical protein
MNPSREPDARIVGAASALAETVVLDALLAKAATLSGEFPDVPLLAIAAALSYCLPSALRAPTAALILDAEAEQAGHRSRVRIQVAELVGSHRQGIQRLYELADAAKAREVTGGGPAPAGNDQG